MPVESPPPRPYPFADVFRISIEPHDEGRSAIRVKAVSGRALWIATMRHLLVGEAVASGAARAIVVGVYDEGPFGPAGGMSLKMTKNTTRESKKTKGLDTDRL